MPETAVIDLGLDRPDLEPEPAPLSGWWSRRWRLPVRAASAVVAVALVVSLAGAAGPADPPLQQFWTLPVAGGVEDPWGRYVVDGDQLFTVDPDRLAAHRLADGKVDWQVPLDAAQVIRVRVVAGLVLVIFGSSNHTEASTPAPASACGPFRTDCSGRQKIAC